MNRRSLLLCATGLAACALSAHAQTTLLVSQTPAGAAGNARSSNVRGTPELRFLVWHSDASDLVAGDLNGHEDVFLRDAWTAETELVSLGDHAQPGDGDSHWPTLSADARFVAFQSFATNLVAADTNGTADVFVRDRVARTTICASLAPGGLPANGPSRYPMISRDGRLLVFESVATNLVAGDVNGKKDVFVRDLAAGSTRCLSLAPSGQPGDGHSSAPTFSPDGTHVVFESEASNLVAGDTNGVQDIFVCDLATGALRRASESASGQGADGASYDAYLSLDGRFATFRSRTTNLVPGDTNGVQDVFVKDLASGAVLRASLTSYGGQVRWDCYAPWITPDARFVLFSCPDPNIVPGDTNGCSDLFLRDLVLGSVERVDLGFLGQEADADASYPVPSDDANRFVFDSLATTLVPGDGNAARDVFLRERASSFQEFCSGDGSTSGACPCANPGLAGRGCGNSAAAGGAHLGARGSTHPDLVRLDVDGEPPGAFSIVLAGDGAHGAATTFGAGLRCIAGSLVRLYAHAAPGGALTVPQPGEDPITVRSAALGSSVLPGSLRWYQVGYRDPSLGACPGASFNCTNAVRVAW